MRKPTTVSAPGWNVSVTTSSARQGATLGVFRGFFRGKARKGDADGRRFTTLDEAWAYARSHGYIEPHRIPWCPIHRCPHYFIGARSTCALAGGYAYPGWEEAQHTWDAAGPARASYQYRRLPPETEPLS